MKTILNLIITTFGVLFILSACGGGGVTVGLEDRTCTNNAFSDDCGTSGTGTRTRIIKACLEKGEPCKDTTPEVETCLTDLFSAECEAVAETAFVRTDVTIAELRMTFCETNKANDNCQTTPTVMQTCMNDPFDTDCGAIYNTNRETACRANNTPACAATITRFCEMDAVGSPANVFDTLCATYNTARENACRTGNHANLCGDTITRYCETDAVDTPANVFNPLCGDVKYNTPRETACRTGNHDSLCSATITRYCETDPTLAKNFNSLCSTNTVATMARNNHCGLGAENGAMATAFTDMRCADDTKGVEVRNAHCVMGGIAVGGNAFKTECALNSAGNALLLTASACMNAEADCLPSLRIICEAEVASFNGLCGDARMTLCIDGALFTESLCNAPTYEMGRETACVNGVSGIAAQCDTLYTKYCGAGAENPFDMTAGETETIDCLAQNSFAPVRQTLCGNSRPAPSSKFETECNNLRGWYRRFTFCCII